MTPGRRLSALSSENAVTRLGGFRDGEIYRNQMESILKSRRPKTGFALVVTLSLMILLTIIAVGLLSLSSLALRSSSQGASMSTAKANARLALMLALGDLQKQTGIDTRVTARADVLDETNPPVLGVWKSWEGADHATTGTFAGRPISPGSDYKAVKKTRFLSWLVSGSAMSLADSSAVPDVAPDTGKIPLVGAGSVGKSPGREKLQIHLAPALVTTGNTKGGVAWWIGGENQKARLPKPYKPANDTAAGWAIQTKSHAIADPKVFRMDALLDDAMAADKAISLHQSDLIAPKQGDLTASAEFFHDLSATSVGLLTNTATGGWRKDLSLMTENYSMLPKTNLPFFRVKPGEDLFYNLPARAGNYQPSKALLYHWSDYRNRNSSTIAEMGAISSWACLANFATSYKSMQSSGSAIDLQYSYTDDSNSLKNYDYHHKIRILPVLARIQWVFSYWAGAPPSGAPAGTLEPRLLVTPVFTLWNPYNVEITYTMGSGDQQSLTFWQRASLPNSFRYTVNGVQNERYHSFLPSNNNTPTAPFAESRAGPWSGSLIYSIKNSFTLKPGQTLVFSPKETDRAYPTAELELKPGYRPGGGHYFPIQKDTGPMPPVPASASMTADARFDSIYNDTKSGVGLYLDVLTKPGTGVNYTFRTLAYRMVINPAIAAEMYPAISGLASTTLEEAKLQPLPFLTTIVGPRTASNTFLAAKGLVQTSPLSNYSELGKGLGYPGDSHPINSLFDYSFKPLSAADSFFPNSGPDNCGYIITGLNSDKGLSRCVLSELPTRPLQSLPELTHWDLRLDNPAPPFSYNSIANSDASPLLPRDAVTNPENAGRGSADLQHDDSYCMNHLLFDDWFISSLAPNSAAFGAPGAGDTLKKTYSDFLTGIVPLPNRAYRPIPADSAPATQSPANIDALYEKNINTSDSWKTIAARLEVEGMFNVNSASEVAWRALLGHGRGQKIPYFDATATPSLSAEQDYAFTRFSVSGDVEAKSPMSHSGTFPGAAEFSGYRTLDDALLTGLAKEIVKQVRSRGPFLSLSEFVNRQLSNDETLAIGGAIQTALDTLAANSNANIYAKLQKPGTESTANPPAFADSGYKFPKAAVGYNAYGLPGWTRQADVLRPIAPILSVRDDTFTIRAYGDARDASGKVTARATCEATVRRTRDFVDPSDAPDITTLPIAAVNLTFGRRYQIISFRWLTDAEI